MPVKKIVVKVSIVDNKCKICVMKAVSKLEGINSVAVDAEKGTVTVVGDVDPTLIVKQLRKNCMQAMIDSVGPPEKKEEKKEDIKCQPPCWTPYPPVAVVPDCDTGGCTIL